MPWKQSLWFVQNMPRTPWIEVTAPEGPLDTWWDRLFPFALGIACLLAAESRAIFRAP